MSNTKELMSNKAHKANSTLVNFLDGKHNLTSPEKVEEVANKLVGFPQAECSVKHHVGAGIYIRELIVPAGTFLIGHHHKTEHMNVLVKGRVVMLDEDGLTVERKAGFTYKSTGGRKVGLVIEDMIWQNIYPNPENETDFDVLEDRFVSKTEGWDKHSAKMNSLEYICRHTDRESYKKLINDGDDIQDYLAAIDGEFIPFPEGSYSVKTSESNIDGKGLFLLSPVISGEFIAPVNINKEVTPAGRYINHAISPNAELVLLENGDINLVSIKKIKGCHGGNSGEEITINYRKEISLLSTGRSLCQ